MNPTTSADALTQLQGAQSKAQDPNAILTGQRQQLGADTAQNTVTGLRGAINNTTKLLNQVAPSVMGRTANSLVTNAQATRQIGNEQAPLSRDLTQEGTDYNQATTNLNDLNREAETAASGIYQGQQDKLSYAQNLYNTLYNQEQNAQKERDAQAAQQEQIRQFNTSLAARSSGSSAPTFNLGGGSNIPTASAPAQSSPKVSQQTYNQVKDMLGRSDQNAIKAEFNAITTSAGYGNQNDITKLKLLHDLNPGLFTGRTNALKLIGL